MKERIRQIMTREAMSQQDFASTLGISPATLSSILNGRTNPTNNLVQAVHRAFPKINISWLMFGEGTIDNPSAQSEEAIPEGIDSRVEDASSLFNNTSSEGELTSKLGHGYDNKDEKQGDLFTSSMPRSSTMESQRQLHKAPIRENSPRTEPCQDPSRHVSEELMQQKRNSIDIPRREIREIRVFYSDGTYETFGPTSSEIAYPRKK